MKVIALIFGLMLLSLTAWAQISIPYQRRAPDPLPIPRHVDAPTAKQNRAKQRKPRSQLGLPPVGSWQTLASIGGAPLAAPALLSDGTLLVHEYQSNTFFKLTPDNTGNYATGTWSTIATLPSPYAPTYYASEVLPNGHYVISGGEYQPDGSQTDTNLGAIYDPAADTWANLPGWGGNIGDAASVVLPTGSVNAGRILISSCCSPPGTGQGILIEGSLTYIITGTVGKADSTEEEGLILLPNGLVMTVDTGNCGGTELYTPNTGVWTAAATNPVGCGTNLEMGPAVLKGSTGVVYQFGGLYTGAPNPVGVYNVSAGTWASTTSMPAISSENYSTSDGAAAMLPNGMVFVCGSPQTGSPLTGHPVVCWEFDGTTYIQQPSTLNFVSDNSFYINMILLPNGQVAVTDFADAIAFYTPSSGQTEPAPTITSVPGTLALATTYTLTGTQLGGTTNGASYGDDYQGNTNYPIIAIKNTASGHIFYATTMNWTVSVTPSVSGSTEFVLNPATELGASSLYAIANGVQSSPTSVTIGASSTAAGRFRL